MAKKYIPDSPKAIEVKPANGKAFTLEELQEQVGGFIEQIRTRDGVPVIINEEGKHLGLPLNKSATEIMAGAISASDYIAGPALVFDDPKELGA